MPLGQTRSCFKSRLKFSAGRVAIRVREAAVLRAGLLRTDAVVQLADSQTGKPLKAKGSLFASLLCALGTCRKGPIAPQHHTALQPLPTNGYGTSSAAWLADQGLLSFLLLLFSEVWLLGAALPRSEQGGGEEAECGSRQQWCLALSHKTRLSVQESNIQ